MKTTNLLIIVFLGMNQLVIAQEDFIMVDAKKISDSETPAAVIAAIEKDFPDLQTVEYYVFPMEQVESEWAVTVEDNWKPDDELDHYTVLLKGKKGGYVYGLYNKHGELQQLKMLAKDFALPSNIQSQATTGKYSGYRIKSDKYVKIVNHKTKKEFIEVSVTNGKDNKKLVFTQNGELIKEKG